MGQGVGSQQHVSARQQGQFAALYQKIGSVHALPPGGKPDGFGDEQWAQWARHYEMINRIQPVHHWYAAQCWAFAHNVPATIRNIQHLGSIGQKIDRRTLMEQFGGLEGHGEWDIL